MIVCVCMCVRVCGYKSACHSLFFVLFVGTRSFINQHIHNLEMKHKHELKAKDERIAELMKVMYARTSRT